MERTFFMRKYSIKVYILQSFIFTYDIYFEIMKADQIMWGEGFEWKILLIK